MSDPKKRSPEEQAAFEEGVSETRAEFAAKARAGEKAETPKHLDLDYSGPLTGDQAQERITKHGVLPYAGSHRDKETKPAATPATKGSK